MTGLAPEVTRTINDAQVSLNNLADRLEAIGDPISPMARVFAVMAEAQNRLSVDSDLKSAARQEQLTRLVAEARKPLTAEEVQSLCTHLDQRLLHRWTQFNRTAVAICAAFAVLFGATCVAGGYWWRGEVPVLAGVSAGPNRCEDQPNGGQLCWIPVWQKLPQISNPR